VSSSPYSRSMPASLWRTAASKGLPVSMQANNGMARLVVPKQNTYIGDGAQRNAAWAGA
jgi:hypothetical protein